MASSLFSPMAMDAIGEIFNISLGSSATAVSNMLARRVDITTPTVSLVSAEDFTLGNLQPAIGVKIDYIAGLSGRNIMLLKRSDVRAIADILLGTETKDEDFQINELNMSAICEVMNQMMGAASTAMSDFLSRMVNISTPHAFEIQSLDEFVQEYFPLGGTMVVVRFQLSIENAVESEFMSALSMDLARELLEGFNIGGADVGLPEEASPQAASASTPTPAAAEPASAGATLSQDEIERLLAQTMTVEEKPAETPPQASVQPASAQEVPVKMPPQEASSEMPQMQMPQMPYPPYGMQMPYPPMYYMPQQPMEPKTIKTSNPAMPELDNRAAQLTQEQEGNLDLLMSVPVDVSVEIGRTRRRVKDILNYTKGSLVVLDRLAGDRADLYVNGKCIAKGDIVVVDDNFGIRIAEIIEPLELEDLSK